MNLNNELMRMNPIDKISLVHCLLVDQIKSAEFLKSVWVVSASNSEHAAVNLHVVFLARHEVNVGVLVLEVIISLLR